MVCVLQSAGCKGNVVLQLALWMVYGQVAQKSSCPKLCRLKCWVTELSMAHNFIMLNNILASLLHINRTCFVASKIKEWDTFLIYGACFVVHQEWKSKIFYTFMMRVSSHHCLKKEICYSFIPLVLPRDGLKNKVYYTHSLFKKNQLVCLFPSTDKIWATWRSIWDDLQSSQVKHTFQDAIKEFIIRKLNRAVGCCRFEIHLCIVACVMSHKFTCKAVLKFLLAEFSWIWCKCLWNSFMHSKIFNLTKYREVLIKFSLLIFRHAGMPIWIWI